MGQFIRITAADGFTLPAYVATPEGQPRAAMVVVQEIKPALQRPLLPSALCVVATQDTLVGHHHQATYKMQTDV